MRIHFHSELIILVLLAAGVAIPTAGAEGELADVTIVAFDQGGSRISIESLEMNEIGTGKAYSPSIDSERSNIATASVPQGYYEVRLAVDGFYLATANLALFQERAVVPMWLVIGQVSDVPIARVLVDMHCVDRSNVVYWAKLTPARSRRIFGRETLYLERMSEEGRFEFSNLPVGAYLLTVLGSEITTEAAAKPADIVLVKSELVDLRGVGDGATKRLEIRDGRCVDPR